MASTSSRAHTARNQAFHHVVIVGGGFGGLNAAKSLGNVPGVKVTLIDRRNFHLFQPLLYQVATGYLSPGEIASPLRRVMKPFKNVSTLMAEVTGFDPDQKKVFLRDGELSFDSLIIATGSSHSYFGKDEWSERAPGLKTLENAIDMRHRILTAFEAAERETDPARRSAWLNFVIVGGGPTGVELAGAIAELAQRTFRGEFRTFNPCAIRIHIVEGADRLLMAYPDTLSQQAHKDLKDLNVIVKPQTLVTDIDNDTVTMKNREGEETQVVAKTILWAAGVRASDLGRKIAEKTGAEVDRTGRVKVNSDLSVGTHPNIFIVGDLANFQPEGKDMPLPGVAPVAIQEGHFVAKVLKARMEGKAAPVFEYTDRGTMAIIGKNRAVAKVGSMHFTGFVAWFMWMVIHVMHLVEFDNRVAVTFQWILDYFLRKRSARLITVKDPFPLVPFKQQQAETVEAPEREKACV